MFKIVLIAFEEIKIAFEIDRNFIEMYLKRFEIVWITIESALNTIAMHLKIIVR